ncbi:MAG: hypothetical protein MR510_14825 [Clostridium sp.]|uniref:hypothetical protein n=1 Tax=Clostridium sp. TaxID=1506 RepID=UPI0025FCDA4A|nr:hypothetical protein [Clostridium sp.]MCI6693723.1 hypothetical protein [Clostridium sp.]MDY4251648.1 hypothetical protein [Clostridium sp.]
MGAISINVSIFKNGKVDFTRIKCRIHFVEENNKNKFVNKIYVNGEEVKDKKFIINTTEDNKDILLPDLF